MVRPLTQHGWWLLAGLAGVKARKESGVFEPLASGHETALTDP